MAGAGYKLFNTGDVLTAAQVNTYLQEQTVMVFASSAARTSALSGVLAEGMMSYLQDTNAVQVYNGTAWVAVGGGASPLTTKGDLYGFSTVDARIPIGTNGQVLTADSAQTLGLKWATPAGGGGKVLQVVNSSTSTSTTIASTSMTDSGLSGTITPSLATSKILVIVTQRVRAKRNVSGRIVGNAQILRDATVISAESEVIELMAGSVTLDGTPQIGIQSTYANAYLDTPNTTSAITYKTQFSANTTSDSGSVICQSASGLSYITLIEIGA